MASETFAFYCEGGCRGWTVYPFDTEIAGDYIFKCPGCGHEHYRVVKDGKITDVRHSRRSEASGAIVIEPTRAAFHKTNPLQALETKGPLGDLWSRFARE